MSNHIHIVYNGIVSIYLDRKLSNFSCYLFSGGNPDTSTQRIWIINRSPRLTFCRPKLLQMLYPCVLSAPPPPPPATAYHRWAQSAMDRWIDTDTIDRPYWSCWPPIVSIHRLKIFSFWSIVSIIDHKILVKPMTIDPLVHFQPMVSIHQSEIDSPINIFLNEREPSKIILQQ
jgi:hypothetical protein